MDEISYREYEACRLPASLQRRLARELRPKLEVLTLMNDLWVLGVMDSGDSFGEEIARMLGARFTVLPVAPVFMEDERRTLIGAVSASDDAMELTDRGKTPHFGRDETTTRMQHAKLTLLTQVRGTPSSEEWLAQRSTVCDHTVILADAAIVSESVFGTAVRSLELNRVRRMVPVGAMVLRRAIVGPYRFARPTLYQREFERLDDALTEIRRLRQHG